MKKHVGIILTILGTFVLGCALTAIYKDKENYTPGEVKAIIVESYKRGAEAGIVYCINHTKDTI